MFRHEDALLRFAFRNTTLGVEATGREAVLKSEEWVRHCCLNNTRKSIILCCLQFLGKIDMLISFYLYYSFR